MRTCPECGTENEDFFRFCLGCGADLDKVLGPVEVKPAPSVAPAGEARPSRTSPRPGTPSAVPATGADIAPASQADEQPLPATMVRHKGATTDTSPRPGGATTAVELEPRPAERKSPGRLVLILEDGTDGAVYDLNPDKTTIGREGADIGFPHDDFLAPRHAEFHHVGAQLQLTPLESTNGVFVQVSHEVELRSGDVFRIGQELLCFELLSEVIGSPEVGPDEVVRLGSPVPEGAWGRLGQLVAPATWGAVYLLGGSDIYLGRERGDITFPGDGFVSGLHAVIMQRDGRYFLKDLGSSNGTYYRLGRTTQLRRGALVLAGQQLFRVEY